MTHCLSLSDGHSLFTSTSTFLCIYWLLIKPSCPDQTHVAQLFSSYLWLSVSLTPLPPALSPLLPLVRPASAPSEHQGRIPLHISFCRIFYRASLGTARLLCVSCCMFDSALLEQNWLWNGFIILEPLTPLSMWNVTTTDSTAGCFAHSLHTPPLLFNKGWLVCSARSWSSICSGQMQKFQTLISI